MIKLVLADPHDHVDPIDSFQEEVRAIEQGWYDTELHGYVGDAR